MSYLMSYDLCLMSHLMSNVICSQLLEVRPAQLLAAEGTGLGAQDVDVVYYSEGSGESLDTHELRKLLDTVGSSKQRHERRRSRCNC